MVITTNPISCIVLSRRVESNPGSMLRLYSRFRLSFPSVTHAFRIPKIQKSSSSSQTLDRRSERNFAPHSSRHGQPYALLTRAPEQGSHAEKEMVRAPHGTAF